MYTLRRIVALTAVLLWALGISVSTGQASPIGPSYPAPGGNAWVGNGVNGASGTAVWNFSNFDTSGLSALYYGLNQVDYGPAGAGLDGTLSDFVFSGVAGQTATWNATTTWYNSITLAPTPTNLRLTMTVTGLGATPWITDLASIGLDDVGSYGILGAVVDNSAGQDFTLSWAIEANIGGSWMALNSVPQNSLYDGKTGSSIATGFYAVPLPPAIFMLGSALFGLGLIGRRKLA